jgi:hypothetical protein
MPNEYTHKPVTIRIPATAMRGWQRGAGWTATVDTPDGDGYWRADGKTQAEATANLAALVATAAARAGEPPVLVIGGGPGYETCIHLVTATPWGYDVDIVRDGRHSGSWMGRAESMDEAVADVRRHVGGTPVVVRC